MAKDEPEDHIRVLAEKELGHFIKDENWTPEWRAYWKQYFHARNYAFEGKMGDLRNAKG